MGCKIGQPRDGPRRAAIYGNKSNTLRRIQIKIDHLRGDLERINKYIEGNPTRRLKNRINKILKTYNLHTRYETNHTNIINTRDTIKQKLCVQVARQRKYKLSNQRRENNRLFNNNEKQFYRKIRSNANTSDDVYPSKNSAENYWSSLWSNTQKHNESALWIEKEKEKYQEKKMSTCLITCDQVKRIIAKTHNWKSPGPDHIQNFWFKRFTAVHQKLTELLNECLQNPATFPIIFTKGKTYLMAKNNGFKGNPANGRPITCLPTIYKILTACIGDLINTYLTQNDIMCVEQKGCKKHAKGCKEQLIIDQIILEQAAKKNRNLHMCFIDYMKAFDSIPHSWLIEVLNIYGIHSTIVNFLEHNMTRWRTNIEMFTQNGVIRTDEISIRQGIFQGDCLSALWFCMALNPLSNLLRNAKYGFKIKGNSRECKINHLMYMDDLKIYASTRETLDKLIKIVEDFSNDIRMKFGIEKCRKISIVRGKIVKFENFEQNESIIKDMEEDELYKYLGVSQSRRIAHKAVKDKVYSEFKGRIHKIAKTNLQGKSLIKAINTFAIPILTYCFGIIQWTTTEIQAMQRKIRTMLTEYKFHHPKSCCERMTMPRKEGGRGLIDLQELHDNQIISMREYFLKNAENDILFKILTEADKHYTPLNLEGTFERKAQDRQCKEQAWAIKPLHGRYYRSTNADNVDKIMSHKWLTCGTLFAETEAFMIAIQDQVIPTRNYCKFIMSDPSLISDKCRQCGEQTETVDHILAGCTCLAQREYTKRHNNVVNILHKQICNKYRLIDRENVPYYKYTPQAVYDNPDVKIYYDRTIYSDHTRLHNRPDITIVDKRRREGLFIDVAIPMTKNMDRTYFEKCSRYAELAVETKRNWNLNKIEILPIIISAEGVTPKSLLSHIRRLELNQRIIDDIQKSVIIDSCHITRKFLNIN
ncbi:uncharacterized protein LOC119664965 [Teleopsis dalmanni]|nr:uncharacterized protein LOC119664965 [Teleopsis dalmanni]